MRKLIATSIACFCALFLVQASAHAQQVDISYGGGTITAPAPTSSAESLRGGFYSTIGGDVLFFHHLGVGADVSWRGSRNVYPLISSSGPELVPYRPVFFDFDAVYAPALPTHFVQPELKAGIGAEDIRFDIPNYYTYRPYTTSAHFMGVLGAGLKFYVFGNFFVRPEADVYLVHNNYEFSALHATRVGISIGYTLGSH